MLLDGYEAPLWVRDILDDIAASEFADVRLIVLNDEPPPPPIRQNLLGRISSKVAGQLFWQYSKLDDRRNLSQDSVLRSTDLSASLTDVEAIRVKPRRKGYVHRFAADDLQRIRAHKLDVLLRFGFNILRGGVLNAARHGIWSYHHDDNAEYRGGPAMFWEMFEGSAVTGTILQVLTDQLDGGRVIQRTWGATENTVWLNKNRELLFRKAVPFVLRGLRQLYLSNGAGIDAEPTCDNYAKDRIYRSPTNLQMARYLISSGWNAAVGNAIDRLTDVQWFLAYRNEPSRFLANSATVDASHFTPIEPPADESWADPFPFTHNEEDYVFFERSKLPSGQGDISFLKFDADGVPGPAEVALACDHHLSYPFIFEWEGDIYMIPESSETNSVQLFRATEFPTRWEFEQNLLTGFPMVDATLHRHSDDRWYMFVNVSERGGPLNDELFVFHAESPLGPWLPHAANPVKSDVRSARPAGRLFSRNGELLRPSQDCSVTYGYAINLCRVEELSPTSYRERVVDRVEPNWRRSLKGCHTINSTERMEVIDGKRLVRARR